MLSNLLKYLRMPLFQATAYYEALSLSSGPTITAIMHMRFSLRTLLVFPVLTGVTIYFCDYCSSYRLQHGHPRTIRLSFVVLDVDTKSPLHGAVVRVDQLETSFASSPTGSDGRTPVVLGVRCIDTGSCFRREHRPRTWDCYVSVSGREFSSPRYKFDNLMKGTELNHDMVITLEAKKKGISNNE
jgi:hypothetical protein